MKKGVCGEERTQRQRWRENEEEEKRRGEGDVSKATIFL